ncbi:MAG: class I SAM-dependent RNA methyltransferase [Longimicrobiales bacterium]|nr:class I SAM-dependent RNA methyltransferase [Longimicrobiales bacterium]
MSTQTPPATVDVEIRAVASGGDGVGELPDGRVVFVPRTAPGDRVRVRVDQDRSSWARAALVEILGEGDARVEPPCPLYARCGGCQLQHLPYASQLEWKGRFVTDALERIGKLPDAPDPDVVPSPRIERYRSRMTFTLRRLRGGRVVAGLHALDRPGHVVDIHDECLLPRSGLLRSWVELRDQWGGGAHRLPDGGRLRLHLRTVGSGVELLVEGGAPGWRSGGLLDDVPSLAAVWHRPTGDHRAALVAGVSDPGGGDAFEQVNPEVADALYDHVVRVSAAERPSEGTPSPRAVVEAYCGAATVGRRLAARGDRVVGIERNASAVEAARHEAPSGLQVVEGPVEQHLAAHLPCDTLIVNPPRTGLDDPVPDIVRSAPPPKLVYVSCDPATLARDVALLKSRFRLTGLRSFDLFPHTAHVETVAVLSRGEGA